VNKNSCN